MDYLLFSGEESWPLSNRPKSRRINLREVNANLSYSDNRFPACCNRSAGDCLILSGVDVEKL